METGATPSDEGCGARESATDLGRRIAELVSTQARVIARQAEQGRVRRRWAFVLGRAAGVVGLIASMFTVSAGGRAVDLCWLISPAWILGAMPILVLAQRDAGASPIPGARAGEGAEITDDIRRSIEVEPSRFESGTRGMERSGRTLHAHAGKPRHRRRRIVPRERRIIVTTHDGRHLRATIADPSPSGIAWIEVSLRFERGQSVVVGRTWARVALTWEKGIASELEAELDSSTFDEQVLL